MRYSEKSQSFEGLLERYNHALLREFGDDPAPLTGPPSVHIVGLPRSGTTVLYQLLARTRSVGYPSNVMAFAWRAPHVGAALQQKLAHEGYDLSLRSTAGRTDEPLGPHEFGYFWRDALGHDHNSLVPSRGERPAHWLRGQLDLVSTTFGAPTVYKNFLAPAHVRHLSAAVGNQHFIVLRRNLIDVARSLLATRRQLNIPDDEPFGTQPVNVRRHYANVLERVCHQVSSLDETLSTTGLLDLPTTLQVDYSKLCSSTEFQLKRVLSAIGADPPQNETPSNLSTTNSSDHWIEDHEHRYLKSELT